MKAISVVDMPKNCFTCLYFKTTGYYQYCSKVSKTVGNYKPNWCPLRPLPTDILGAYVNSFAEDYISFTEGWDSYEKALMGETE